MNAKTGLSLHNLLYIPHIITDYESCGVCIKMTKEFKTLKDQKNFLQEVIYG